MGMKRYAGVTAVLAVTVVLSGCNIYRPYKRPDMKVQGLYRDTVSVNDTLRGDTTNMGNLPWQEVFTDAKLQKLIQQGLDNNIDLQTAILRVKEAQAQLTSARSAFAPGFSLAPSGTVASFDKRKATWTYQLPLSASWEVDLFGKLLNSKRGAKAALLQSEAGRQGVRTQVIATVANLYYTLLMLDRQLSISEETAENLKLTVEMMKSLKSAGMTNEAGVVQAEANYFSVVASLSDLKQSIRETENSFSILLGQTPQAIDRGTIEEQRLPDRLAAGIPVQLLSNRPDVKQAEMALAAAYANTNVARASFYPGLSLTGAFGWTNDAGSMVINPGKMIATATASLVQPLFAKGANRARLNVAKAQQEEARLAFQYALLNAGSEVSNALYQYKTADDKGVWRDQQISSLEKSVDYTKELMQIGSATYLEVITAQQSLLSAQLSGVQDDYQRMEAVVNLYHALGGGRGEKTLREKDMKVYDSVYEKATRQTRADRKKAAKEIR